MRARVIVMPKRDVLDPQGKAVSGALHSLGHQCVQGARVGKLIVLDLDPRMTLEEAEESVRHMCESLLANLVIEEYEFTLEG